MFNLFRKIFKNREKPSDKASYRGSYECIEGAYERICPKCGSTKLDYMLLGKQPYYQIPTEITTVTGKRVPKIEQYYYITCKVTCLSCNYTWTCFGEYSELEDLETSEELETIENKEAAELEKEEQLKEELEVEEEVKEVEEALEETEASMEDTQESETVEESDASEDEDEE